MSLAVVRKLELAISAWLASRDGLYTIRIFQGHGTDTMDELPRLIVTATAPGGDLANSGIYKCSVEILIVTDSEEPDTLAQLQDAVTSATCEEAVMATTEIDGYPGLLEYLNKPASGPDTRIIKGFGISGYDAADAAEGADTNKKFLGSLHPATAWCHLEAA